MDTKPTTPAKRPSKVKLLEAELKLRDERIRTLESDLAAQKDIVRRRDESDKALTEDLKKEKTKTTALLAALKPFNKKTEKWPEPWPGDDLVLSGGLTFGDIRGARETYRAHI